MMSSQSSLLWTEESVSAPLGFGRDREICSLLCEGSIEEPGDDGEVATLIVGCCARI